MNNLKYIIIFLIVWVVYLLIYLFINICSKDPDWPYRKKLPPDVKTDIKERTFEAVCVYLSEPVDSRLDPKVFFIVEHRKHGRYSGKCRPGQYMIGDTVVVVQIGGTYYTTDDIKVNKL